MGTLTGLRPPQFSEDPAWLPGWLQQCDPEPLNVEVMYKELTTFQQRVEGLQSLQMTTTEGESLMDKGGFMIGHLFLSGSENSPFTCAQSTDNVVQPHLHLSLEGNSEKTSLTTDESQTESGHPLVMQPLQNSGVLQGKVDELSPIHNTNLSSMVQLGKPPDKHESSKHVKSEKFSQAAADAAELCIAASEALAIHEIVRSDPFMKRYPASTILEATLQVKQARLEIWTNTIDSSINGLNAIDLLTDLDDLAMESAYADAGINFDQVHDIELSVSQVKDTFDSESDESVKYENCGPAIDCRKSSDDTPTKRMESVLQDDRQLIEDISLKCCDGDMQKKVTTDPDWCVGFASMQWHSDCLEIVPKANVDLPTSVEKVNFTMAEEDPFQANANSSPNGSCQRDENCYNAMNIVQERFQSRWFGGWTCEREARCLTPMKRSIPGPFAQEVSFLSESADIAPDETSFVQNQDTGTITASQSSIASDLCNKVKDGMLLSQDVPQPSSAPFADPLCSVVPCSISENIGSSAQDHDNISLPRHVSNTIKHANDNLPRTSASDDDLAQGEASAVEMPTTNEPHQKVHRQYTSFRNYSMLLPSRSTFLGKESSQRRSLLINSNVKLTPLRRCLSNFKETSKSEVGFPVLQKQEKGSSPTLVLNRGTHCNFQVSNCSMHNLGEENLNKVTLKENVVECSPSEKLEKAELDCKSKTAIKFSATKRLSFQEPETNIPATKKLQRLQPASKTGYSRNAAKKVRYSSPCFDSRSQLLKHHPTKYFGEDRKRLIFQNTEFILTGFSHHKEKEIVGLIRKHGGVVLSEVPSPSSRRKRSFRIEPQVPPIVLCLKKYFTDNLKGRDPEYFFSIKMNHPNQENLRVPLSVVGSLQTIKFLYGCAVMAFILKVQWLTDSIAAGLILPPEKYMILSRNVSGRCIQGHSRSYPLIFDNIGFLLLGKPKIFSSMEIIIKHGGGLVFKTLQSLVQSRDAGKIPMGFVVADEKNASRHLKYCAIEQNIPMVSVNWIKKCLHSGELPPLNEKKNPLQFQPSKVPKFQDSIDFSEEI